MCHCRCTAVDFSKNGIATEGLEQLCEVLKNNDALRTLMLGTNSIGDDGAEMLAAFMSSVPYPPSSPTFPPILTLNPYVP